MIRWSLGEASLSRCAWGRTATKRFPLRYDPQYWGMVFALGMYTVCTFQLSKAIDFAPLVIIPRYSSTSRFQGGSRRQSAWFTRCCSRDGWPSRDDATISRALNQPDSRLPTLRLASNEGPQLYSCSSNIDLRFDIPAWNLKVFGL